MSEIGSFFVKKNLEKKYELLSGKSFTQAFCAWEYLTLFCGSSYKILKM
jgi:hypothetical protein